MNQMQIDMYTHLIIQFTNLSKYICILHVEVYIYIYKIYMAHSGIALAFADGGNRGDLEVHAAICC